MDVPYFTGYDNGFDYSGGHGSPGNCLNDLNYSNSFAKEELVSPGTLSPAPHYRHDSMISPSLSGLSRFSVGQHQAEPQPCAAAAELTPHTNSLHSHRSYTMSRGPSQISNRSSTSSGQQHGGYQPYVPQGSCHNDPRTDSVSMLRSASDTSAFHPQPFNYHHSGSLPYNLSTKSFALPSVDTSPTGVPATTQYSLQDGHSDNAVGHLNWSSLAGLNVLGNSIGDLDQTAIEQYYGPCLTLAPSNRPRPRAISFGHPPLSDSLTFASAPIARHDVSTAVHPMSPSSDSGEPSSFPQRRRRRHASASDSEPEIITGHVLASGKFKCSDPGCSDLKFGRQADFRRHYTNVHATKKVEFFCTHKGCDRSKKPAERGKGRSFGSRRDKMEEHVRTVHEKVEKRKKNAPSTEDEENCNDTEEAEQPQSKTQRHF